MEKAIIDKKPESKASAIIDNRKAKECGIDYRLLLNISNPGFLLS